MEDLIVVIEESLPSIVISVVDADTNIAIPPNTNTNSLGSLSDVNTILFAVEVDSIPLQITVFEAALSL